MRSGNPLFLKGLNELRAIAALAVIVHHIELFIYSDKLSFGVYKNKYLNYFLSHLGKNGVYLFFVLSGFLITYLLINENKKYGYINILKFYWRRVLRIWPLYFIIIFISFLLVPVLYQHFQIGHNNNWSRLIMDRENYKTKPFLEYCFFLSNLALDQGHIVVGASQSWSVSLEEQYYIFWPILFLILLKLRTKKIFALSIFIISLIALNYLFKPRITNVFSYEFILIGCLGALVFTSDFFKTRRQKLDQPIIYLSVILLILILLFFGLTDLYLQNILISMAFLLLIILTINNKYSFQSKFLNEIGKISYGVYMYHPFVMFLTFPYIIKHFDSTLAHIFSYLFIILLTLTISKLSYEFIEKKFISIKDKKFKTL